MRGLERRKGVDGASRLTGARLERAGHLPFRSVAVPLDHLSAKERWGLVIPGLVPVLSFFSSASGGEVDGEAGGARLDRPNRDLAGIALIAAVAFVRAIAGGGGTLDLRDLDRHHGLALA